MASRQAAVLARRGAALIACTSSSTAAVWTGCVSSVARSLMDAALPGAERGCATAAFLRRTACSTDPSMRASSQCPSAAISNKRRGVRISPFHSTSSVNAVEEIGMPSLSPTMTQGNIAKWRKKEGDKVSAGDILCEIETDKATLEMESMEDGYLGKILVPDGAKNIPCGQAICLMVETEDELKNIDSHKPTGGGSSPPPKAPAPPPPKAPAPPPPTASAPTAAAVTAPPPSAQKTSSPAAPPPPGVTAIGMPSLSPTMTQGNIVKWRKREGDKVSAGDILCEIETDKATIEMESLEDGYLGKILIGDGSKDIPCDQAICLMVELEDQLKTIGDYKPPSGGSSSPPPPAAAAPSPPHTKAASPASKLSEASPPRPTGSRVFASPAARKLAEDKNVSLSSIKGTGPQGSVVKADIQEYLATGPSPSQRRGVPAGGAIIGDANYRDVPNTQIRTITAKRLLQSKQTIPHYYLSLDTRVDKLLRLREDLNRILEASIKKDGPVKKVSLNDLVIKAAALALKKVPEVNASWNEEFIRQYHNVNISIAVQTEHGLMVPVVKDADKKDLVTITDDIKALARKARSNTLKPNDYEGGTFTVSNLGSFGIKQFCAIVNPPQACILAVGSTEKRVCLRPDPDSYEPGTFMTVTLSCDHRVIDGAIGAQWLGAFKGFIEDPITLMH